MSSADTETPSDELAVPTDEARELLLGRIHAALGDTIVETHLEPGLDLWVRVTPESWADAAQKLRDEVGCDLFGFVSAIDWMPSPFGREMDAEVDNFVNGVVPADPEPMEQGFAGGDTRFQVFARLWSTTELFGFNLKADVPDDLTVGTWINTYPGANWHEREAWEMYGVIFEGHPDLRHLYLPTEFEGFPGRKDFPLLARRVKPWPGIVDVETMPGDDAGDDA